MFNIEKKATAHDPEGPSNGNESLERLRSVERYTAFAKYQRLSIVLFVAIAGFIYITVTV